MCWAYLGLWFKLRVQIQCRGSWGCSYSYPAPPLGQELQAAACFSFSSHIPGAWHRAVQLLYSPGWKRKAASRRQFDWWWLIDWLIDGLMQVRSCQAAPYSLCEELHTHSNSNFTAAMKKKSLFITIKLLLGTLVVVRSIFQSQSKSQVYYRTCFRRYPSILHATFLA